MIYKSGGVFLVSDQCNQRLGASHVISTDWRHPQINNTYSRTFGAADARSNFTKTRTQWDHGYRLTDNAFRRVLDSADWAVCIQLGPRSACQKTESI
jgi:hypothetical protein